MPAFTLLGQHLLSFRKGAMLPNLRIRLFGTFSTPPGHDALAFPNARIEPLLGKHLETPRKGAMLSKTKTLSFSPEDGQAVKATLLRHPLSPAHSGPCSRIFQMPAFTILGQHLLSFRKGGDAVEFSNSPF